ncbi:nuclear hormone receptor FTZ-F1-like, partial [Drosophila navojoa]
MENFTVPLVAESSASSIVSYAASRNNDSNNQHLQHLQQQHHQHQLLSLYHKDQMLAAGSSPISPFINYAQLQKDTQSNPDSYPTVDSFTSLQAIDSSQLDVVVSLNGLCDRIFASPNPHSSNSTNNNLIDAKVSEPPSGNNRPLILESVTMSSFANILFNSRNNTNTDTNTNTNTNTNTDTNTN